jgi:xylan 1,4-beta-xylosidase
MAGLMHGDRVKTESSGHSSPAASAGANAADINALAVRSERELSVLVWNYSADDVPGPASQIHVNVANLPANLGRALLTQYRIDQTHSNAYAAWQQLGSPQNPTPEQYATMRTAGELQNFDSPHWITIREGEAEVEVLLPRQAVALLQLRW